MPYYDMTRWAFTHIDIQRELVVNEEGVVIELLNPDAFNQMYMLKASQVQINSQFVDEFYALNLRPSKVIMFWWHDEENLKE